MEGAMRDNNRVREETRRILVVPMPFQGHIQPMIELCLKIVEEGGYRVTVANTKENHERIMAAEPRWLDLGGGGGSGIDLVVLEGLQEEKDVLEKVVGAVRKPYQRAVETVMAAMETPPCCIISDFRMAFTLDMAKAAGIPRVGLWTQSAAHFASNLLFSQGFKPPPDDTECITCLPGVPPHTRSDVSILSFDSSTLDQTLKGTSIFKQIDSSTLDQTLKRTSIFKHIVDEYAQPPFRRIHESSYVVIINTFEGLERQALDGLQEKLGFRPLAIGPLVNKPSWTASPQTSNNELASHLAWLDQYPPESILYIAFGTISRISSEQLQELVEGLKDSKQRFLWAFRQDLVVDNPYKDDLEIVFKDQGKIVPWVSQWDILSHPSVGGFLTHAGWNSTLEGITTGVPMLTWPQLVDQFLTRKCVEAQWGVGFGLYGRDGFVKREEICEKVRELMHGERGARAREKLRSLNQEAREAFAKGGTSSRCLQELLRNNFGNMIYKY